MRPYKQALIHIIESCSIGVIPHKKADITSHAWRE